MLRILCPTSFPLTYRNASALAVAAFVIWNARVTSKNARAATDVSPTRSPPSPHVGLTAFCGTPTAKGMSDPTPTNALTNTLYVNEDTVLGMIFTSVIATAMDIAAASVAPTPHNLLYVHSTWPPISPGGSASTTAPEKAVSTPHQLSRLMGSRKNRDANTTAITGKRYTRARLIPIGRSLIDTVLRSWPTKATTPRARRRGRTRGGSRIGDKGNQKDAMRKASRLPKPRKVVISKMGMETMASLTRTVSKAKHCKAGGK